MPFRSGIWPTSSLLWVKAVIVADPLGSAVPINVSEKTKASCPLGSLVEYGAPPPIHPGPASPPMTPSSDWSAVAVGMVAGWQSLPCVAFGVTGGAGALVRRGAGGCPAAAAGEG